MLSTMCSFDFGGADLQTFVREIEWANADEDFYAEVFSVLAANEIKACGCTGRGVIMRGAVVCERSLPTLLRLHSMICPSRSASVAAP